MTPIATQGAADHPGGVLAHRYLAETGTSLRWLARKIVREQQGRLEQGFYFHDRDAAALYSGWAVASLTLWGCILESLDDPIVDDLVRAVDPTLVDQAAG